LCRSFRFICLNGYPSAFANVEKPRFRGKNVPIVTNGTNGVKKSGAWRLPEERPPVVVDQDE
jgi:hypothetical protein